MTQHAARLQVEAETDAASPELQEVGLLPFLLRTAQ